MRTKECVCGVNFRTAEDYRDHLPCNLPIMQRPPMRERLWHKYMELKGHKWDGYSAPELNPDIQSKQVLALMTFVEELEEKIDRIEAELKK